MIRQSFSYIYREIFTSSARYFFLWGGRGRGGSYTATNYALHRLTRPTYFRGYFMREIASDIRESLWRDFNDRVEENKSLDRRILDLKESTMVAKCRTTGNVIISKGFRKSAKKRTAKLKSLAGATHVFIEEAEEISEDDFIQLDDTLRTNKAGIQIQIFLIFNPPPRRHWIWAKWFNLQDAYVQGGDIPKEGYFRATLKATASKTCCSIFSAYMDNLVNTNETTVALWESYKSDNPDHYWTMIRGLISEGARGRIYKGWQRILEMPNTYAKFYGLDWGFSGDPLAMIECEAHNRKLYLDEMIYERGLVNDQLELRLIALKIPKWAPVIYDNAQPKDGEDMRRRGWNFIPCVKGPGSKKSGIKYLQQYAIFATERSKNLWTEFEEYAYALDQYKQPTEEPIEHNDHAMDAINYAMDRVRNPSGVSFIKPGPAETGNRRTNYSA